MADKLTGSAGTILVKEYGCWLTVPEASREFDAERIRWEVWGPRLMKRLLDGDVKAAAETLTATQSGETKSGIYRRIEQWVWAMVSPGSTFLKLSEADAKLPYSPDSRSVYLTLRGIRLCDTDMSRMLGRYVTSSVDVIPLNRRRFVTEAAQDGLSKEDLADDWLIRAVMKTGAEGGISEEDLNEVTERVARERAEGARPVVADFDESEFAELTKRLVRRRGEGPFDPMPPTISRKHVDDRIREVLDAQPQPASPPRRARDNPMSDREIKAWHRGLTRAEKTLGVTALWDRAKDDNPGRHIPRKQIEPFGENRGTGHRATKRSSRKSSP